MAECRYFPECQRCNEVGDSWLPCAGGADGTRCKGYEPMPDVKALLSVADALDDLAARESELTPLGYSAMANRIREALGVER